MALNFLHYSQVCLTSTMKICFSQVQKVMFIKKTRLRQFASYSLTAHHSFISEKLLHLSIIYGHGTSTPPNDLRVLMPSVILLRRQTTDHKKYRNRQQTGSKSANHSARTQPFDPVEPNVSVSLEVRCSD